MNRSDQQLIEKFMTTVCSGSFAEQLARVYSVDGQVPDDAPQLSVILENRTILGFSAKELGTFEAARRHFAMLSSFVHLIEGFQRLGTILVDEWPSHELLEELKQHELNRRRQVPN